MPQNQKLLPPLPTFVDRTHPRVIAWRQDLHENAINELHQSKMENTKVFDPPVPRDGRNLDHRSPLA